MTIPSLEEINNQCEALDYARDMAELAWYTTVRREAEATPQYGTKLANHQKQIQVLTEMKDHLLSEKKFWHR